MERLTIENISVLLVEPSAVQRTVIEKALRDAGVMQVVGVDNGRTALDEALRYPPDLIVSSLYLADMSGSELLETLRQTSATAAIPFILISTETKFGVLDPIRQAGAVAILPKPFSADQLSRALYATLDLLEPDALLHSGVDLSPLRVLLVDDSQLAREHMRRLLESIEIVDITEAGDGEQATRILEQTPFDLVISDYNMPRVDGKELAMHVRQHRRLGGCPRMATVARIRLIERDFSVI